MLIGSKKQKNCFRFLFFMRFRVGRKLGFLQQLLGLEALLLKKVLSIAVLSLILVACSQETGSYALIVVVNDVEYGGTEETLDGYETDKIKGK